MRTLQLNHNAHIPILGFGTWQLTGDTCRASVETALEVGFRHIDTADRYGNHKQVAQALKNSRLKREELFITTKVWRDKLKKKDVIETAKRFLDELQLEYIDLLLIHWPNKSIPIADSLEGFAQLREDKLIKANGVSNFTVKHLKDALATGLEFTVNQVEFHPSLNQDELKRFCDDHGIVVTAYSPLAQGQDLKLPAVMELATKYNRTSSQILLNWLISKNIVAIPRSSNRGRIRDNFEAAAWQMDPEDVAKLENLSTNNRIVNPSFSEFNYR